MNASHFILASTSPRRQQLLREAGFQFEIVPSLTEELHDPSLSPETLVTTNALLKAAEVSNEHPESLVLGSDTLVYRDGVPLGKPKDMDAAFQMVRSLAGQTHQVATGVALLQQSNTLEHLFSEVTNVTFHPLNDQEVRDYLDSIEPLDKAGGYAAQENGERIISSIQGSMQNVIGLPVQRVITEMTKLGFQTLLPVEKN